jgi:hypothetical protein
LIDKIEDIIFLINSNTDGIFFKVKKKDIPELKRRVSEWEERTQLQMEYSEFTRFISKDVNNYLAIKTDGKIHAKGAYVKDLSDLDYDLPIVNEALRNYMIFGTPVEITINACSDFRKFQKIVKLSNKYKWVEHENGYGTTKYDNKAYRIFASLDNNDGRLMKCDGVRNPAKFGNTPDRCFIYNGDLNGVAIPSKLDKQYYIDLLVCIYDENGSFHYGENGPFDIVNSEQYNLDVDTPANSYICTEGSVGHGYIASLYLEPTYGKTISLYTGEGMTPTRWKSLLVVKTADGWKEGRTAYLKTDNGWKKVTQIPVKTNQGWK